MTKAIRNCIAKTSSWGCFKVRGKTDTKIHQLYPAKLAGHSYAPAGV